MGKPKNAERLGDNENKMSKVNSFFIYLFIYLFFRFSVYRLFIFIYDSDVMQCMQCNVCNVVSNLSRCVYVKMLK